MITSSYISETLLPFSLRGFTLQASLLDGVADLIAIVTS